MSYYDLTFDSMGCKVRLLIGDPLPGSPPGAAAAKRERLFIERFDTALSRFKPDSELTALNEDPREVVPASPLLRQAVQAGLWAAERSEGLVDPTLGAAIAAAGYRESRTGVSPEPLVEALAAASSRRPASPGPSAEWRLIEVDDARGTIRRPPGLIFDTGGSGKGLAADLVAARLRGYSSYVVDCGGDVRIGGFAAELNPFAVHARHPLDDEPAAIFTIGRGGIATSGLDVRLWRREDGSFAHHLLDPSTGRPAWTGLIGATAIGQTALEAETISKAALLSGPQRGRELLAPFGGLLVHDDGRVEVAGAVRAKLIGRRSRLPAETALARH